MDVNLFYGEGHDDDEITVVSTTKKKWEKLHNNAPGAIKDGNKIFQEDDFVLQTKPARPIRSNVPLWIKFSNTSFRSPINYWYTVVSFLLIASLVLVLYTRRKSRRKSNFAAPTVASYETTEIHISTTTTTMAEQITQAKSTFIHPHQPSVPTDSSGRNIDDHTICSDCCGENVVLKETSDEILVTTQHVQLSTSMNTPEQKLEMARQLAEDTQLLQKVLQEQSMDPSLAPQLAMCLQSSHHLVQSQRELHYQQAVWTYHQRQLDRQLSEQQHRESIQAIKYDSNWKEKLRHQRDKCWNVSNGFFRLVWEVLLIQQAVRGILPVWKHYNSYNNYDWDNAEGKRGGFYNRLLRDMLWSVLSQICDCPGQHSTSLHGEDATMVTWKSTIGAYAVVSSTGIYPISSVLLLVHKSLSSWFDMDFCTCYGYCLISLSLLGMTTAMFHYLLRLLAIPHILHHIVNAMGWGFFYGPDRIATSFGNTVATLFAIPMSSSTYSITSRIEFALMISMLVGLPLVSWYKTQKLYNDIRKRVSEADTSEFEKTFHGGQAALEHWKWEQVAVRYILLSVYMALLLGGGDCLTTGSSTVA
jgi:hypothetical protein